LIAQVDSKIVGFVSLSPSSWCIQALYIHPKWIRQGTGKKLLASIEGVAVERSIRVLRVVSSFNAAPFYQSQGYLFRGHHQIRDQNEIYIPCQLLYKQLLTNDASAASLNRYLRVALTAVFSLMRHSSSSGQTNCVNAEDSLNPELF
jgi:ribosomal protein S18 acetylase RimI-like enzyme